MSCVESNIQNIKKFCRTSNFSFIENMNDEIKIFFYESSILAYKDIDDKNETIKNNIIVILTNLSIYKLYTIYLRVQPRIDYANRIKTYLPPINYGKNCINGLNESLLDNVDLLSMISGGSFGNVYKASVGKLNKDYFVIKIAKILKNTNKKINNEQNPNLELETCLLNEVIKPLIVNKICPNFPLVIASYNCDLCNFNFQIKKDKFIKKKAPCSVTFIEVASGVLPDWFLDKRTTEEILSALFQLSAALYALGKHGQVLNNDIKSLNILFYKVKKGGYWTYKIDGINYYVPNFGYIFIVNDFGVSRDYRYIKKYCKLRNKKYDKIGTYLGLIINDVLTPFDTKFIYRTDANGTRIKKTEPYNNINKNKFYIKDISGYHKKLKLPKESYISYIDTPSYFNTKNMKIYGPDINFSDEQLKELNKSRYGTDTSDINFYKNPNIPNIYLTADFIDLLKVFFSSFEDYRETQEGPHFNDGRQINREFENIIKKYTVHYTTFGFHNRVVFSSRLETILPQYFIKDLYGKGKYNYTIKPKKGINLETYTI